MGGIYSFCSWDHLHEYTRSDAAKKVAKTAYARETKKVKESLKTASDFKQRAVAGCVMVNLPTAGTDYHVPFGGRKASSFGPREQGQYAREFYTTVKTTYLQA